MDFVCLLAYLAYSALFCYDVLFRKMNLCLNVWMTFLWDLAVMKGSRLFMELLCVVLWPPLQSPGLWLKKKRWLPPSSSCCLQRYEEYGEHKGSQSNVSFCRSAAHNKICQSCFYHRVFLFCSCCVLDSSSVSFPRWLEYHEGFLPECSQQRQIFQDRLRSNIIHDKDVTAVPILPP